MKRRILFIFLVLVLIPFYVVKAEDALDPIEPTEPTQPSQPTQNNNTNNEPRESSEPSESPSQSTDNNKVVIEPRESSEDSLKTEAYKILKPSSMCYYRIDKKNRIVISARTNASGGALPHISINYPDSKDHSTEINGVLQDIDKYVANSKGFCPSSLCLKCSERQGKQNCTIEGFNKTPGQCDHEHKYVEATDHKNKCAYYSIYKERFDIIGKYIKYLNKKKDCDNNCKSEKKKFSGLRKEYKQEWLKYCSSILGDRDYDDKCVKPCIKLPKKLGVEDIYDNENCDVSENIIAFAYNILKWVRYIAPVLVIVLGILDFIKALAAQDDDAMKKAQGRFIKRLIAATLLFLLPLIIDYLLNIFDLYHSECDVTDLFK